MKVLSLFLAALALSTAPAFAGCKDGAQLDLSGTVSRMFANKAGGWSITVTHLNDEVLHCDLGLLMGTKTPAPFFVLAVTTRPPAKCRVGSPIRATLAISEGLADFDAKTVRWQCG